MLGSFFCKRKPLSVLFLKRFPPSLYPLQESRIKSMLVYWFIAVCSPQWLPQVDMLGLFNYTTTLLEVQELPPHLLLAPRLPYL